MGSIEKTEEAVSKALRAFDQDDYRSSVKMAELAKANASRSSMIRELLGLSLYQLGRWQEASRELLTYRRLTNRVDQDHLIADCYRALKRPDRALEICNEVTSRDVSPEVWAEVNIVAAAAYADKGQFDEGLARLSQADMDPRSVEPYHLRLWYLRSDLLEKAGRRPEAVKGWERIAAEDPDFFDVAERLEPR